MDVTTIGVFRIFHCSSFCIFGNHELGFFHSDNRYCIYVLYNVLVFAILWDVYSYNEYKKTKDILMLMGYAIIEPIVFHPIVVWAAVRGNFKKIIGIKSGWGSQVRKGFAKAT